MENFPSLALRFAWPAFICGFVCAYLDYIFKVAMPVDYYWIPVRHLSVREEGRRPGEWMDGG